MAKSPRKPPDIAPNIKTGKYHPDTGGTSVFDRAGVLTPANGDFYLLEGTDIPPELKIEKMISIKD